MGSGLFSSKTRPATEKKTPFKYADVKEPLFDTQGNPIPLGCDFITRGLFKYINCFLVKSGETFIENDVEYTSASVALDEQGLTFTVLIRQGNWPILSPAVSRYPDGVYREGPEPLKGPSGSGFSYSQIDIGEEFFLQAAYDIDNLEAKIEEARSQGNQAAAFEYGKILEFRKATINIFQSTKSKKFHQDMLLRSELTGSYAVGVSK